jgi:putative transposase
MAFGRGAREDQRQALHLWRAVDHEGEVLETGVTAKRDKAAALKLLKRIMRKFGRPRMIFTDGLRAYSAAMKEVGNADPQEVGGHLKHNVKRRKGGAIHSRTSTGTSGSYI